MYRMARDWSAVYVKLAEQSGLTPSARSRFHMDVQGDDWDEEASLAAWKARRDAGRDAVDE